MKKNSREKKKKKNKDLEKFILSPGDYIGEIPVRQDIIFLPAEDPSKLRLGWVICEGEHSFQKHIKDTDGEEALKKYLYNNHPKRLKETNLADVYRTSHGVNYVPIESTRGGTLDVLPELYGKPYNNYALNKIHALRPSSIRATSGAVTLDSSRWRVTVILEDDNITIRNIYQEVEFGAYGTGEYKDVSNSPSADIGMAVINDYAVSKIKVK